MQVKGVDPRDQKWERDSPTYRVYFWERTGTSDLSGWRSDEWELSAADVDEVLSWADEHADGRLVNVWLVHNDAHGLGLIRLMGRDPTDSSS